MPWTNSQVSGDRTLTEVTPAFTIWRVNSLVSSSFRSAMTSPVVGETTLSANNRPKMRSAKDWPATSSEALIVMPSSVPQSSLLTMISWATSTKRRVKYPASAVRRAVSARPLRAPCVEIKYSNAVSPSRKLDWIGIGMIRPEGSAIKPRIPANCVMGL